MGTEDDGASRGLLRTLVGLPWLGIPWGLATLRTAEARPEAERLALRERGGLQIGCGSIAPALVFALIVATGASLAEPPRFPAGKAPPEIDEILDELTGPRREAALEDLGEVAPTMKERDHRRAFEVARAGFWGAPRNVGYRWRVVEALLAAPYEEANAEALRALFVDVSGPDARRGVARTFAHLASSPEPDALPTLAALSSHMPSCGSLIREDRSCAGTGAVRQPLLEGVEPRLADAAAVLAAMSSVEPTSEEGYLWIELAGAYCRRGIRTEVLAPHSARLLEHLVRERDDDVWDEPDYAAVAALGCVHDEASHAWLWRSLDEEEDLTERKLLAVEAILRRGESPPDELIDEIVRLASRSAWRAYRTLSAGQLEARIPLRWRAAEVQAWSAFDGLEDAPVTLAHRVLEVAGRDAHFFVIGPAEMRSIAGPFVESGPPVCAPTVASLLEHSYDTRLTNEAWLDILVDRMRATCPEVGP